MIKKYKNKFCEYCNKEFILVSARQKFCSILCRNKNDLLKKYNKIWFVCKNCNKKFIPAQASNTSYCTLKCSSLDPNRTSKIKGTLKNVINSRKDEQKKKISEKIRVKINEFLKINKNEWLEARYKTLKENQKNGKYKYSGIFMKSNWEIGLAKMLDSYGIKWEYEPKIFHLKEIRKSYIIDFYLPQFDLYLEVKGWMDDLSKSKIKTFKKEYPNENIEILMEDELRELGVL